MNRTYPSVREGDVYEVLSVDGGTFEIRYGYYENFERDGMNPIPIYPDLMKTPIYGVSGKRIVTFMQEPCGHYEPREEGAEAFCGCCKHYPRNQQMINVCMCKHNQLVGTQEKRSVV